MNEIRGSSKPLFPHLTKAQRLPNCYKEAEKLIKSVKSCQINFKTAVQNLKVRGCQFKKVYKLTLNVLKYYNYIQKIIDETQLLQKEKFLRKELAAVLIYELIFGNGYLPGESKPITTIQVHQNDLINVHQRLQSSSVDILNLKEMYIRRYVRVHTLLTTVADVIKDLENYGFRQIFYDESLSEEKYLELAKSLKKGNFLVDFHFKDILVFSQDENLIGLDLYKNGHIFLQDKASYIPVHALNPKPGSTVLDACAAPGMKSAHIAAKMKNKGTLIVCERDKNRFETLKETLQYGAVKISKALCTDFKLIDPSDEAYSAVEYILLDPSCSGSGMINRMDEVTDTEDSKTNERLFKLAGFQIILLKHALKFPSVKRVVYSTCSIHEEENEYVVHEVLNAFGDNFKLIPVMPEWSVRGSENYEYGKLCLRTVPEKHLTNGFFVAMFERVDSNEQGRNNFLANFDNCSDGIPLENCNSPKKLKLDTAVKQEISCEGRKSDETTESYLMSNNNRHDESSSSACKKEKYDSYIQISYENSDQIVKDRIHSNYLIEKGDALKIPEDVKDKKKKKKKVKEHITSNQFQLNEQIQEGMVNITSSESVQKCDNSKMLESVSCSKVCNGNDVNVVDENTVSLAVKKSKCRKHKSSENKFEINDNCEILTDIQRKKRKKDYSVDENTSSFIVAQGGTHSSDILEGGYQDFDQKVEDVIHNSYTGESTDLNIKGFTKCKKKKKEKEYSADTFQSNKQTLKDAPNVALSESLQKSKNSQISAPSKLCEAEGKKSKRTGHISSENKFESTDKSYKVFVDVEFKHKKKRQHSMAENTPYSIYAQETEPEDKIDSIISKPVEKEKISDFMLPCNMQLECFENKSLKMDGDSFQTTSVKAKKNKKHKKQSKDFDFTSIEFANVLAIDFTRSQNNSEDCTLVNSIENSSSVPHNEEAMKTEQYLTDYSSNCKTNKKHKKHSSKSFSSHENKNINTYSSDCNLSWTTNLNNHEDISVNCPNQNSDVSKKNKKKKRKSCVNEETDNSPNFHDNNTDVLYADLVQDDSKKPFQSNKVKFTTDSIQNSVERKNSNKHKKHSKDNVNCAKIGVSVNNECISTVSTNPNNSLHSEVVSKNCHKTKEYNSRVSQEYPHLLSQSEEELEKILFDNCEIKKIKKRHKRHTNHLTQRLNQECLNFYNI